MYQRFFELHISEKSSYMNAETIDVGEARVVTDICLLLFGGQKQLCRFIFHMPIYIFICQDGSKFKVKHRFRPYFCVAIKDGKETDIEKVKKEDFDVESTLVGLQKSYLKISFVSVKKLMLVKKSLVHVIGRPKTPLTVMSTRPLEDFVDCSYYLCESDVPYHIRFAIDKDIRWGQWYDISVSCDGIIVDRRIDQLQNPELHTCAFYVYTTELRLKDSEAVCHSIMMISYMIDGHGYLIINREKGVVGSWFAEMKDVRPSIYVTYKGDCIDWPFLETKAANHGYNMNEELGFRIDKHKGECHAKFACHLDCFAWVKRDSHQPKRKQGLKSVANVLLGFDPVQDIAKDVVCFARHSPHRMTSYYVSNVVSTYYLYMTHLSLKDLLIIQAYRANVIYPNKQQSDPEIFHPSQLLLSKPYIGGNVECLENSFYVEAIRRFWDRMYAYKGVKVYRPGSLSYNVDRLSILPMDIIKYEF
ncbi:DNA-directed DNA polymerase [Salvia divinorum]|uniref:DNA polymerase epsilon catalytic subunit n=1 Tax=Salvia divinorum TaxID=28513 RepID=A0ABD1GKD4_SALDI